MRPPNIPFTPGARPRSTRRVEKPFRARVSAAAEPAGPAPTTMTSKCSTISRFPRRKSGTGKSLSSEMSVGHRPNLELAARSALRDTRGLLTEEILVDKETADSGHPSCEEMTDRLLGRTVGEGQRTVEPGDRELARIRLEADDLGASPSEERGRIDHALGDLQGERLGNPIREGRVEFQARGRAPLARQVNDALRRPAHCLLELLLDADDEFRADEEARLVGEPQDPRFWIRHKGPREKVSGPFRTDRNEIQLRLGGRGFGVASRHGDPRFPREDAPREPPRMPGQMYRTFAPGCLP